MEELAEANTIKKKIFSRIPDKIIYSLLSSSSDILFYAPKFPDLINARIRYRIKILTVTPFASFTKSEYNISNFPIYFFSKKILFFYQTDPLLESKKAKKFISDIIKWLQSSSIKYLIVSNDWLFIERFLIYCANQVNIKSICIQDGLFSKNSFTEANKKYANYMFSWSSEQAELIKTRGFSDDQVKILGYPHNIKTHHAPPTNKKKICIFGQPYESYSSELGKKKKELFSKLIGFLNDSFKTVVYKPHPGEKDIRYIPEGVETFTGPITDAIEQFDIFISISSTALLEATLADKIAIQIYDETFQSDNLQETGFAYSIDSKNLNEIVYYISSLNSSFLSSCTMPVHENVEQRFIDLLNELQ